jgi:hypothetical protein
MRRPLATVQAFFAALERQDMQAASALVDPLWAADFQADELGHFVAWCQFRDMRATNPSLSGFGSNGKVDEAVLAQYSSRTIPSMPGKPTIQELRTLSPPDFVADFLRGSFLVSGNTKYTCIGELPFDRNNVYVLYYLQHLEGPEEATTKGDVPPYPHVMIVTRRNSAWGVHLGPEFTTSLGLGLGEDEEGSC